MPPRHHLRGMHLPFLDRERELGRLARALDRPGDALLCLYGRRRCGKSRLVQELGRDRPLVYYVGDERDAPLQRAALAREAARLLERFAAVTYPDWEALLDRWWREAPARSTRSRRWSRRRPSSPGCCRSSWTAAATWRARPSCAARRSG
jgi:hypothetical protein